jgi:hypothetical protein
MKSVIMEVLCKRSKICIKVHSTKLATSPHMCSYLVRYMKKVTIVALKVKSENEREKK